MSEQWKVHLVFEEGSSNKFWRARTDGKTLYVNFGRVGSAGQTQIKSFASPAAADSELTKVAESKRKKGYEDLEEEGGEAEEVEEREADADEEEGEEEEGEGEEEEEEEPPAKAAKGAKGAGAVDLALREGGRQVELRLTQDGAQVRTVVVETYDSPAAARAALGRLEESLLAEGYTKAARRDDL